MPCSGSSALHGVNPNWKKKFNSFLNILKHPKFCFNLPTVLMNVLKSYKCPKTDFQKRKGFLINHSSIHRSVISIFFNCARFQLNLAYCSKQSDHETYPTIICCGCNLNLWGSSQYVIYVIIMRIWIMFCSSSDDSDDTIHNVFDEDQMEVWTEAWTRFKYIWT